MKEKLSGWKPGAEMSSKSYCKLASVQSKVLNQPIKRTFGSVMSFVEGSGAEPQPKLKLVPFELQNLGFSWHHFAQTMKTFVQKSRCIYCKLSNYIMLDNTYRMREKYTAKIFCSFWKISKWNVTDILGILYAHNSIITIRLDYSVWKLSVLQWCHLAILACSNYRCLKIARRTGWKTTALINCQRNVASKFTRIEPLGKSCLWNCPRSITSPKPKTV